jgi:hypothetical protein
MYSSWMAYLADGWFVDGARGRSGVGSHEPHARVSHLGGTEDCGYGWDDRLTSSRREFE